MCSDRYSRGYVLSEMRKKRKFGRKWFDPKVSFKNAMGSPMGLPLRGEGGAYPALRFVFLKPLIRKRHALFALILFLFPFVEIETSASKVTTLNIGAPKAFAEPKSEHAEASQPPTSVDFWAIPMALELTDINIDPVENNDQIIPNLEFAPSLEFANESRDLIEEVREDPSPASEKEEVATLTPIFLGEDQSPLKSSITKPSPRALGDAPEPRRIVKPLPRPLDQAAVKAAEKAPPKEAGTNDQIYTLPQDLLEENQKRNEVRSAANAPDAPFPDAADVQKPSETDVRPAPRRVNGAPKELTEPLIAKSAQGARLRPKPRAAILLKAARSGPNALALMRSERPISRPADLRGAVALAPSPSEGSAPNPESEESAAGGAATTEAAAKAAEKRASYDEGERGFSKNRLSLIGIAGSSQSRRAMFRTSTGVVITIKRGEKRFFGEVVAITEDTVRVRSGRKTTIFALPR